MQMAYNQGWVTLKSGFFQGGGSSRHETARGCIDMDGDMIARLFLVRFKEV